MQKRRLKSATMILFFRYLVFLAVGLVTGFGVLSPPSVVAQDGSYTPVFEEANCPSDTLASQPAITCGYLIVPEDRADPAGRQVRLAVAILHAQTDDPALDPVVYLAGGPGQSAISRPSSFFDTLRTERDVILIDQRGSGYSYPNLDCPEVALHDVMEVNLTQGLEAAYTLYSAGLAECRDRLITEGIPLAAYTSATSAADINDLRRALGIEAWNLYSASYGTRVAQTVMRDHPEGVRSVVLDSVLPVEINFTADRTSRTFDAVAALIASCAADAACHHAFPDLEENFFALINQLEQTPVVLSVTNFRKKQVAIPFDGRMVYDMLYGMLYDSELIPALPQLITAMHAGDFSVATIQASRLLGPNLAVGMYINVNCAEETNLTTLDTARANIALSPALEPLFLQAVQDELVQMFAQCELWGVPAADSIENEPVSSPLPTLILNGALDPVTPPTYASMVHDHLPNSFYYEFPALGHDVFFSDPCGREVTLAFLDDPKTAPQPECLDNLHPPEFVVP